MTSPKTNGGELKSNGGAGRKKRLLIVTHRFGPDIPGGAERHVWELATRLRSQESIDCEVWTTDARGLGPVAHWGAMLEPGYKTGEERTEDGLIVRRFPLMKVPRAIVALACKAIQRQWEREETAIPPERFLPFGRETRDDDSVNSDTDSRNAEADLADFLPGPGWHHPEPQADGSLLRWTMPRFSLLRKSGGAEGTFTVSGFAPRPVAVQIGQANRAVGERRVAKGWFTFTVDLPPSGDGGAAVVFQLDSAFCPWRDHRSLGLMVAEMTFRAIGRKSPAIPETVRVPHGEDYRVLLRRRWDDLVGFYLERAGSRPDRFGPLFDWVRGPRCPALWKALRNPALLDRFDGVMATNLPWAVIPAVAASCRLPMAALALWHLDDEFYYWNQYVQSLRTARVVLSNTDWAAKEVWPKMGVNARWAGPGVDERWATEPARKTREQWRGDLGLDPATPVILSVARKSSAKRYDLVVAAVEKLRAAHHASHSDTHPAPTLVLVGPDEDRRPIDSPAAIYTGPMKDADLHEAYCAADAFAMMSESESFGMVYVEAWLRGLPVVGNRWCGPVASLIDHGHDGFLASGVDDLAEALGRLLSDANLRARFGQAGKAKTLRDHTWRSCAARVAMALRERVFE